MNQETVLSPCRLYRYTLWRRVVFETDLAGVFSDDSPTEKQKQYAMFIGLNPSTADETLDDPTIRRCIRFAKDWGYGSLCMTNLFAFRATDPRVMKRQKDPIGLNNDPYLTDCATNAGIVVAAWGSHGSHRNRDSAVKKMMTDHGVQLHALHINSDGSPKHPLYVAANQRLVLF